MSLHEDDEGNDDDDSQSEKIMARDRTFGDIIPDHILDVDEIRTYKGYLKTLELRNSSKLEEAIANLRREEQVRKVSSELRRSLAVPTITTALKADVSCKARIDVVPSVLASDGMSLLQNSEVIEKPTLELESITPRANANLPCLINRAFDVNIAKFEGLLCMHNLRKRLPTENQPQQRQLNKERILDAQRKKAPLRAKEKVEVASKGQLGASKDDKGSRLTQASTSLDASGGSTDHMVSKTYCRNDRRRDHAINGPARNDEVELPKPSNKGKRILPQLSPNTYVWTTVDSGRETRNFHSVDLAGPSPRRRLRSSVKNCNRCHQKFEPTSPQTGDGMKSYLLCSACQKQPKKSQPLAKKKLNNQKTGEVHCQHNSMEEIAAAACTQLEVNNQKAEEVNEEKIRKEQIAAAVKRQRARSRLVLPGITINDGPREIFRAGRFCIMSSDSSSNSSDDEFHERRIQHSSCRMYQPKPAC